MGIQYVRGGIENKDHLRNKMREKGEQQDRAIVRRRQQADSRHEELRRERHAVLKKKGVIGKRYF